MYMMLWNFMKLKTTVYDFTVHVTGTKFQGGPDGPWCGAVQLGLIFFTLDQKK